MRYPIVLLDVGETLVGPRGSFGETYARVLRGLGLELDAERLRRSMEQASAELSRDLPAGADRYAQFPGGEPEYWLRFSRSTIERAAGRPVTDALARRAVERLRDAFLDPAAWEVFPDVVPCLTTLRQAGVRLGVVSNWDSRLPRVLARLGLAPYFQAVGVSRLEGREKPDPALFRCVLERLGGRASEALHVGDVPELDLEGARRAGIDAVLVDRRGRPESARYRPLGDLSELPRIARDGLDGRRLSPA
jgi:putative hydrolase of the HAD superfamily